MLGRKRVSLTELEQFWRAADYQTLVRLVEEALAVGELAPVKSSRLNGKVPPLKQSYWVLAGEQVDETLTEELSFGLHPALDNGYYLAHLKQYQKDRADVLALDRFWRSSGDKLQEAVSLNERSFQIWQREKFLKEGGGVQLLKNLGLSLEALNVYQTAEPLAYYAHQKSVPQNVLIVENKDTFYSLRRHLLQGAAAVLGLTIGTLVYGGGKRICRTMQEFELCGEPYLTQGGNAFYYFGDLDYEGLGIFESLREQLSGWVTLRPFAAAYRLMLAKAAEMTLPETKEGQQPVMAEAFYAAFTAEEQAEIAKILAARRYIPQEILTIADF